MAEDSLEQVDVDDPPADEADGSPDAVAVETDDSVEAAADVTDPSADPAGDAEPADPDPPADAAAAEAEPATEAAESDEAVDASSAAPRFSRSQIVVGALVAVSLLSMIAGWTWWFVADHHGVPDNGIQTALDLLDQGDAYAEAVEAALILKKADFRDPSFPGAATYVLGIAAFWAEQAEPATDQDKVYQRVVDDLQSAQEHLIPDARRPELAYVLGTSLFRLGSFGRARKWLEEAVETYPAAHVSTALQLTDIYVDSHDSASIRKAQQLNTELKQAAGLTALQQQRRGLQEARILLALGNKQQTQSAIQQLLEASGEQVNWELTLIRVRALMNEGELAQAMALLAEMQVQPRMDEWFSRRASYLIGLCHERQGHVDAAISEYKQTVRSYRETQEGAAASLAAADLLRGKQRDEEAILAYKTALSLSSGPADFYNRWIAVDEFRKRIERAWNAWVGQKQFAEAIELTATMSPLFEEAEAQHLNARANELWAEHLQRQMQVAPYRNYAERVDELRGRWRKSGLAYAKLAELRSDSTSYSAICLQSAEHLAKSQDYETALEQLSLHLQSAPVPSVASQVLLGEVYLNMDDMDKAIRVLRRIINSKTTDPAVYRGQLLLGRCFFEKQNWDQAESIWRGMIAANQLGPAAVEWRLVRMELARMRYFRGIKTANQGVAATEPEEQTRLKSEARNLWEQAVDAFREHIDRYPNAAETPEVRYLYAKSQQLLTQQLDDQLQREKIENARKKIEAEIGQRLKVAVAQLMILRRDLTDLEQRGRLNPLGQTMLRDCHFEIGHMFFGLSKIDASYCDDVNGAYLAAINKYPQDLQILPAYVRRMACFRRRGRLTEARGMLEQAKVDLRRIPDHRFAESRSELTREDWLVWLNRLGI